MDIWYIYKHYVEYTNVSFEYQVPTIEEMKYRMKKTMEKYPYLVAVDNGKVIGYTYASEFQQRAAYQWDVELSIYLGDKYHGKNIASYLYNAMFMILNKMNIQNVYACITHPNERSEAFHHKMGFLDVGIFYKCGYKFGKWHDVIWMDRNIGNHQVLPVTYFSCLSKEDIDECIRKCVEDGCIDNW